MNKLLLATLLAISPLFLSAQQTGAFSESVTFTASDYPQTRTLYYHVPTDYDPLLSYKLVVGFRGGPHSNAGQFRDQLTFLSDSLGAIILCPENSAHFWNNEGETKLLFKYSVQRVMDNYSIDSNYVYLTGLSYGGRHAVIVSMDTDDGPIPNLRGVIPFAAGSDSHLQPNYSSIVDFPPACICIGLNDSQNFINVSNNLHDDIQLNNGTSILNEIPGVGHTVAFSGYPTEMMECFNWIESQYGATAISEGLLDAEIQVFPNPASSYIDITYPATLELSDIRIINTAGQVVGTVVMGEKRIDVSTLPAGEYLLQLSSEDQVRIKHFSVVR